MPKINCAKCGQSTLKPDGTEKPVMCSNCVAQLEEEINRIDRNDDRYTKRGKLKNRLHDIPDEAIPKSMALMIEEVADPEINDRQYKLGRMEELKQIDDKEIHDIETDYTEKHRGKIVLKKRYR